MMESTTGNRKRKINQVGAGGEDVKRRKPSGFAQNYEIGSDLCSFLNVPTGTHMGRTDVTKLLIAYIKENKLEKEGYRRHIMPNAALETVVGNAEQRFATMEHHKLRKPNTVPTEQLTYFNLQIHLSRHFTRQAAVSEVAATEVVAAAEA